jgi:hypothetical protein
VGVCGSENDPASYSSLPLCLAVIAAEQGFNAATGLNERFLFISGQALDLVFDFLSPPPSPNLLLIDQFQGTASTKVLCAPVG